MVRWAIFRGRWSPRRDPGTGRRRYRAARGRRPARCACCTSSRASGPGGAERLLVSMAAVADPAAVHHEVAYLLDWKQHLVPELEALGVPTHLLAGRRGMADPRWPRRLRRARRGASTSCTCTRRPSPPSPGRRCGTMRDGPVVVSTEHNVWASHGVAHPARQRAHAPARRGAVGGVATRWSRRCGGRGGRGPRCWSTASRSTRCGAPARERAAARAAAGLGGRRRRGGDRRQPPAPTRTTRRCSRPRRVALGRRAPAAVRVDRPGPARGRAAARLGRRTGSGDRFVMLGYHDDPPAVLAGADVFTLSSRHEGLPISLLEAMALGLPPVVTARRAATPRWSPTSVDGVLVPAGRPRRPGGGLRPPGPATRASGPRLGDAARRAGRGLRHRPHRPHRRGALPAARGALSGRRSIAAVGATAALKRGIGRRREGRGRRRRRCVRPGPAGLVILIYHRVGGAHGVAGRPADRPLRRAGRRAGGAGRLVSPRRGARGASTAATLDDRPVVLTFDDGTADWVDEVLPVLVRHRAPATFYVATDFVERQRRLPRRRAADLLGRAGRAGGVRAGHHRLAHPHPRAARPGRRRATAADELDRSIELIGERLGVDCEHFAYPKALLGSPAAEAEVRRAVPVGHRRRAAGRTRRAPTSTGCTARRSRSPTACGGSVARPPAGCGSRTPPAGSSTAAATPAPRPDARQAADRRGRGGARPAGRRPSRWPSSRWPCGCTMGSPVLFRQVRPGPPRRSRSRS